MDIVLNAAEIAELMGQSPDSKDQGGFQSLLVGLQERLNVQTGALTLTQEDIERIGRYAFDYRSGGWQGRLRRIFERHLGPNLGRA